MPRTADWIQTFPVRNRRLDTGTYNRRLDTGIPTTEDRRVGHRRLDTGNPTAGDHRLDTDNPIVLRAGDRRPCLEPGTTELGTAGWIQDPSLNKPHHIQSRR